MIYRQEHPKPQFERKNWANLNGEWEFQIDNGVSGEARGLYKEGADFSEKINVPFAPESKLSGLEYKDFMNCVWYRRTFTLSKEQLNDRVVLHFGAVDYEATVFVNGCKAFTHKGGYVSFKGDISSLVHEGENTLVVEAKDDTRSRLVPCGKQSEKYDNYICYYTRTTGIWQTVWLEFVPHAYIDSVKYYPNADNGELTVYAKVVGEGNLKICASYEGKDMGGAEVFTHGGDTTLTVKLKEKHLWELGEGRLYDLTLTFNSDEVKSYFGLRKIEYTKNKFYFNNRSVFQRLVLDQGFYPDGVYTAPCDEELHADVTRSLAMGFNGARLHEKVFEERFLYYCDKEGYLVWGEYPNWGLDHTYADSIYGMLGEWLEEIDRDFNHPSIIGWCPFNETWKINGREQFDGLLDLVYRATKAADPTRPCLDTSGSTHVKTDVYDTHTYTQDPKEFEKEFESLKTNGTYVEKRNPKMTVDENTLFFISEYGGVTWSDKTAGFGYGNAPKTEEEFLERVKGLTAVLLDNPGIFAFCYTQLTDVQQELNGLYTYDRKAKFDPKIIAPFFNRKAAIED